MRRFHIDMIEVATLLKGGYSVESIADRLKVSYGTLCKRMREHHITNKGVLSAERISYTKTFKEFLQETSARFINIQEIADFFGTTREKVSSMFASADIQVKWALEENHNDLLASSRRAEVFVKNLGIRVIRDCYTCPTASGKKAPYDLILEGYGSVDCKASRIQFKKGTAFCAFNTQNLSRPSVCKYAFLCVQSLDRSDILAVFAVPTRVIFPARASKPASTTHVTLYPFISEKYKPYLIWENSVNSLVDYTIKNTP